MGIYGIFTDAKREFKKQTQRNPATNSRRVEDSFDGQVGEVSTGGLLLLLGRNSVGGSRQELEDVLPLKKNFSQLLQVGVTGYDQWQVIANIGAVSVGNQILPASIIPYYSVQAVGGQLNYILPVKNLSFFFKYEHEYKASSHTLGNTVVFGGEWTLPIPKPQPQKN